MDSKNKKHPIIERDAETNFMKSMTRNHMDMSDINQMGYFGNIWVKQNVLELAGETHGGHEHKFDHVTLLVSGKVSVEIEGHEPKEFTAPTFIVIRKEHQHKITAVEDGTVYYCVYALRNMDGEPIEDIYGEQHDPESASARDDGYWEKVNKIDK
jgi:hypothetical protein